MFELLHQYIELFFVTCKTEMLKAIKIFLIYFVGVSSLYPCTTILIGKGLSKDGSILHAHNEDMGQNTVGRLWRTKGNTPTDIDSIWVPYVSLTEPSQKLGYWASGNTRAIQSNELNKVTLPYDNILVGMNEAGLTMSCNWMNSKELPMEGKGIRRYAIRQLILERCSTSYEAVLLIGSLIEQFGQADWGGLTYVLADPIEGWIVETTTHTWVAKKLKDNEIIAIANRFTIGENYDVSSANLISHAINSGWYNPSAGPFNFKLAYGNPDYMNDIYDSEREGRVNELFNPKKGTITPLDLMEVLKDRYQNTGHYCSPTDFEPWRDICQEKGIKRPICTNLCQSSFVAHLRSNLPIELGPVFWFTFATPAYGPYFPIYPVGTKIDNRFSIDDPKDTYSNAWWNYRHIQQKVDIMDRGTMDHIQSQSQVQTNMILVNHFNWEKQMLEQLKNNQLNQAISTANRFTNLSARFSLNFVKRQLK